MGASIWVLLCVLLTFASATGDNESPARVVQQLVEADQLFWAWVQFFAVIWVGCLGLTITTWLEEEYPGWRSGAYHQGHTKTGHVASDFEATLQANLNTSAESDHLLTSTSSNGIDDGDSESLCSYPGYEMPWWDPALAYIDEMDLDSLAANIATRQETDARPYFEYDDIFLTLLLIPSAHAATAHAADNTAGNTADDAEIFGTFVKTDSADAECSAFTGLAETPVQPIAPRGIVNWSSAAVLGNTDVAGTTALTRTTLDSFEREPDTVDIAWDLNGTSVSTSTTLSAAPVSRPLMHWSSIPILSGKAPSNTPISPESALQPHLAAFSTDALLSSDDRKQAVVVTASSVSLNATSQDSIATASDSTSGTPGKLAPDAGKGVAAPASSDSSSPVPAALAAAVTAILASNASAAGHAAIHSARATAAPEVPSKTGRKDLGLLRISSNRGSLRSMSTSWVQRLSFKRRNTEDPAIDTIKSNSITDSNNSNDAISKEPETASPAKRRLRTTESFKIGAQRIANTVAPSCFGKSTVA